MTSPSLNNMPYLILAPRKVHRFWWTCIPALPTKRGSYEDIMLRRIWADHTMNTLRVEANGNIRANSRSFYAEGTEDHVIPATFQTWAIISNLAGWIPGFLSALGAATQGAVRKVRWSYLFEQPYQGKKFCIADIVFYWEDDAGAGVVVIECKVRGGSLTSKDTSGLERYLHMPSINSIERRSVAFIVDESDAAKVRSKTDNAHPISTWQAMMGMQMDAILSSNFSGVSSDKVAAVVQAHGRYHGLLSSEVFPSTPSLLPGLGTPESYANTLALRTEPELEAFLLGSEAAFAVRQGVLPAPPYDWLARDPDALRLVQEWKAGAPTRQTTAERRIPHWRGLSL